MDRKETIRKTMAFIIFFGLFFLNTGCVPVGKTNDVPAAVKKGESISDMKLPDQPASTAIDSGVPARILQVSYEENLTPPTARVLAAKMAAFSLPSRSLTVSRGGGVDEERAAYLKALREKEMKEAEERALLEKEKAEKKAALEEQKREKEKKAEAIDIFYKNNGCPLSGYGETFVEVAERNGLDYRQLPAHAFLESTGGRHLFRRYNPFGWGSKNFSSFDEAIEVVGANLGGNDPDTQYIYRGKTFEQKVLAYNHENPNYLGNMKSIMRQISEIYISLD